jgi:hypothetical protein
MSARAAWAARWASPGRAGGGLRRPGPALCGTLPGGCCAGWATRRGRARRRPRCLAGSRWRLRRQRPRPRGVARRPTRPARCPRCPSSTPMRCWPTRPGPPASGRCTRGRALPRRGRAAGPGGRPHPGRHASLLQGQPALRRPLQVRCAVAPDEFAAWGSAPARVVQQCGSGVTACHNLLAMAHAGLGLGAVPGLLERMVQRPPGSARSPGVEGWVDRCQGSTRTAAAHWGSHFRGARHVQAHPGPHRRVRHHRQGGADRDRSGQADQGASCSSSASRSRFPTAPSPRCSRCRRRSSSTPRSASPRRTSRRSLTPPLPPAWCTGHTVEAPAPLGGDPRPCQVAVLRPDRDGLARPPGCGALLLGSETQKVLTHSALPVLVVR